MKTLLAMASIAAALSAQTVFAAKDDYTQMLIWKAMEAKRVQAQIPGKLRMAMFKFHPLAPAK